MTQINQMKENSNYEADMKYTIQLARGVLNLIGVWPSSRTSSTFKNLLRKLRNMLCQFLPYFILIPGLLRMFLKESNPQRRMKAIGPMCNSLMSISKYTILTLRSNQIKECMSFIDSDWKNVQFLEDRKTMIECAKIGRTLAIFSVAFVYGSGFCYRIILPMTRGTIVTDQNITIRPLSADFGYYVFFNPQISPAYEIVYSLQIMAAFVQYTVLSGAVCLSALFVLHACGQLKILTIKLEGFVESVGFGERNIEKKIASVVEHHIRIKSFLNAVENLLQHVCLVEVIGCTLIICLLGYYIIMEWEDNQAVAIISYTILLITFTCNLFIFCFIGELLNDQGMKFYIKTCTLNWYRVPDKTARLLVLIIATSSTPIKITAGKFLDLSLNSFGNIIRTSVAYLNMLRATSI